MDVRLFVTVSSSSTSFMRERVQRLSRKAAPTRRMHAVVSFQIDG